VRLGERHAQAHHFILLTLFFGLALLLDFLLAPLLGLGGLRSIRHTAFIHNIFTSHLSLAPRSKAFLAAMLILQSLLLCQHLLFALPLVFLMLPLPWFVREIMCLLETKGSSCKKSQPIRGSLMAAS
jgi:hypothetical protein